MLDTVNQHIAFLQTQREVREQHLNTILAMLYIQMDSFMAGHGWHRQGRGKKVMYTKTFNGQPITIEFRIKIDESIGAGGLPQFVHDKSVANLPGLIQASYFHWNEQERSGWSLDQVMERMESFYQDHTRAKIGEAGI